MTKGLFIMNNQLINVVNPPTVKREIEALTTIYAAPLTADTVKEDKSVLKDVEVI